MTKPLRPGVFDPWRQEAPAPTASEATPIQDDQEPEADDGLNRVLFEGAVGGISVYVPEDANDPVAVARSQLVDVVFKLIDTTKGGRVLFERYGIGTIKSSAPAHTRISDGVRNFYISNEHTLNPTTALTLALREAQRELPGAPAVLETAHVVPFIK